jgi:hypothetical protein
MKTIHAGNQQKDTENIPKYWVPDPQKRENGQANAI